MLSDSEIINICMRHYADADTFTQTLQEDRADALDYYNQEPYGDEVEGRSQFVTSEVRDTIEWTLPQVIEQFVGDENPVLFSAKDGADVESAKLESEYVRHVIQEQNEGFLSLYTFIKDGLLQKNGVVKVYWDENIESREETYEGQDIFGYQALVSEQAIEIIETTVRFGEEEYTLEEAEALALPFEQMLFDVRARAKEDNSQVKIKPIASENFFVKKDHASLDLSDCSMICERAVVTGSDLIVDGYPRDLVDSIPVGTEQEYDQEHVNRFSDEGSADVGDYIDPGMKEIQIYEFYIQIDADGDGKSELRLIKLAGPNGSVVLENEVVDSIPYCAWTPVIQTHKFYGMSYADLVKDLQRLRSVLMRQMLDNLYLANNPVKTVVSDDVNPEDLLYSGPGATWRVKQQDAVKVHTTPFVAGQSFPMMELTEEMRNDRTGVSPVSQGLDPAALKDSTNLVGPMIMNMALQRIKMVARIFAETGYKQMVRKVHELCLKFGNKGVFEYGGQFTEIDPREWKERKRFTIKVGVGHVDRMQRLAAIQSVIGLQKDIVANGGLEGPLLTAKNVHTALVEQAKLSGYPDGEKFFRDPATYQAPEPKEDVNEKLVEVEQSKVVADMNKKAAETALDKQKLEVEKYKIDQDVALRQEKMKQEADLAREEMVLKYGRS